MLAPWKKSYDQPRQHIKKHSHDVAKICLVKAMVFPVVMCGCESSTIKKAECQGIDAFELWLLEKTLESPLGSKEIQPVHPKGDQPWVFIGRTDAEAEVPVLWPPDAKSHCCSLSSDQLFGTPWTPWTSACQASLSFAIFQSLLKLMSIESVMPSNHLILCHPLLLLLSILPSISVYSSESALHIRKRP